MIIDNSNGEHDSNNPQEEEYSQVLNKILTLLKSHNNKSLIDRFSNNICGKLIPKIFLRKQTLSQNF